MRPFINYVMHLGEGVSDSVMRCDGGGGGRVGCYLKKSAKIDFLRSSEFMYVQVFTNCPYSVLQMCTGEEYSPSFLAWLLR